MNQYGLFNSEDEDDVQYSQNEAEPKENYYSDAFSSEFPFIKTKLSLTLKSIAGFLKFITISWIIHYLYLEFKSRFPYEGVINCFPLIEFPIVTDISLDPLKKGIWTIWND